MEIKFKVLVLRILMAILYRLAFPNKAVGKDDKELDKLAVEVHNFIKDADELGRTPFPSPPISPATKADPGPTKQGGGNVQHPKLKQPKTESKEVHA